MSAGLELQALELRAGDRLIARLQAQIAPGETLTVMGPSGAGKSSLLAAISGTLPPGLAATGRVLLDGRDISALPAQARHIGLLFQDDLLFPHLSVASNLAFGLPASVRGRPARLARIENALDQVGLNGFAFRDPATLSGGQRARVALMRTLLAEPRALLLDEPFSRLDAALKDQVRALVFDQARARKLPLLLVTHDPQDARAAGGPVIELPAG